ncbi:MAG TPA: hypothetical protein VH142_16115 [Polyangiaceae bacterium]|jgi:hypothetical protein|nr:hypothetical protein [Polyangiaceae bacterium]
MGMPRHDLTTLGRPACASRVAKSWHSSGPGARRAHPERTTAAPMLTTAAPIATAALERRSSLRHRQMSAEFVSLRPRGSSGARII